MSPGHNLPRFLAIIAAIFAGCLSVAAQQGKPLVRTFTPGEVEEFRVEVVARSEVEGQRAEKIGARAYATPFRMFSQEALAWRATRRVLSVDANGTAEIEETLDLFSRLEALPQDADDLKGKTDAALRLALLEWSRGGKITLRYRQNSRGEIAGLSAEAAPLLDSEPAVLSVWLRHAARPRAVLRGALGDSDSRWNEPRAVQLPPWKDARGAESGEWLAGPFPQLSSVRFDTLHVNQQLQAKVPAIAGVLGEGEAKFHSESVSTVVGAGSVTHGAYGSLVQASRSASREVSRALPPVEGLPEPPRFRSRLTVEIRITRADWPPQ